MSELVIESPDFDRIRKGNGPATEDAVKLLWFALNDEISTRRQTAKQIKDVFCPRVKIEPSTASLNNYDATGYTILYFTGASAINLTGISNGVEGRCLVIYTLGAGTVTIKNASASSSTVNQILTASAGDLALTTNLSAILVYLNTKWRQAKLA